VAIDEVTGALVDDDPGDVADRLQDLAKGRALGLAMRAPVRQVGEELVRCLGAKAGDA
jgi:hypothetical protein